MQFSIIFPGQGSQSLGMMADLAQHFPQVEETFQEASDVLGYNLWQLCQEGPAENLNQTQCTQPALLTSGIAVWRALSPALNKLPAAFAGHSLGEYTALVAAGSIAFADAVSLVEQRGKLMQQAVPEGQGKMAAVLGMDDETVVTTCKSVAKGDEVLQAVNFNSPGQVVIAGSAAAVDRFAEQGKALGAKMVKVLPVSVPSHCALMKPAAEQLAEILNTIDVLTPTIPVVHNVDASSKDKPDDIRNALVAQLHQPVRWVECVQQLISHHETAHILEAGPGKVLTGLGKRIDRAVPTLAVFDAASFNTALETINNVYCI